MTSLILSVSDLMLTCNLLPINLSGCHGEAIFFRFTI